MLLYLLTITYLPPIALLSVLKFDPGRDRGGQKSHSAQGKYI